MIKNLLLDLDDTILDFHHAEADAIRKTLLQSGVRPTADIITRYSQINAVMWKKLEKGEITRGEALIKRFELLFGELGVSLQAESANRLYKRNLSEGYYFVEGAERFLENAYRRYDLYLVSNGTAAVQDCRIASAGIGRYFKKIFISERVGFVKPDKRFFDVCFGQISDFCREETIIVGDSLSSDIAGGKNAGILTCLFNPDRKNIDENIRPDYVIVKLDELTPLLEKL